jgi:GT2 family glycosyltransferase
VLTRLERQIAGFDRYDVIVISDAAEENLAEVSTVADRRPYAMRHLQGDRPGASSARNVGWRAAEAPVVLFLDDDVLPERRLVEEHISWHTRHPDDDVGVLGHVRWARELHVTPFMRWLENGIQFNYPSISGIEATWGHFYTANVSVKRSLLERVGGFDEESLPFGYEDLDLAYRMNELGLRLLYNRRASAEHLHPMTVEFWQRRVRRIAAAEYQFVRMHPDVPPYFLELFRSAAALPPARGRGARLARVLPPRTPFIGPIIWRYADIAYRQALAPNFLDTWSELERSQ